MPVADAEPKSPPGGELAGPSRTGSSLRLYERLYDILSEQITAGALPAHQALTETSVAAQFGISRAPARRALEKLEQAGLLARAVPRGFLPHRPGKGGAGLVARPREPAERLVSQPSWEPIYAEVESEIIARISFATWRVNEAELARRYRVSRTVSRDVIGRLQQRGIVRKDDRSRWFAPGLSPVHVGELYELRRLLEPVALEKAAGNLPAGVLADTRARLVVALEGPAAIDGDTLDALERDLHVTVLAHCGNRALMQAIVQPQSLLVAHRFLYRWTARMFEREPFLAEHLDVVDKLATGRAAEAAAALAAHLDISRDRALSRIGLIAAGAEPEPVSYLERIGA